MNHSPDQMVGRVVGGRYRLERVIGTGGMGAVFHATQVDLKRAVAVKMLLEIDVRSIERLRQEALTAGGLSCPYIVSIYDFQAPPGEAPFVVMELLAGESLAQRLVRERALPVDEACRIAVEALIGLDFAHAAGVLHRDIKPSNIWLSSGRGMEGHVKVVDFGIAKLVGDEGGIHTTTGSLLGTPAYLSPEQLRGQDASVRSDQHAIGLVLFEMLTGMRPWQSQGVALYAEVLERVPPSVDRIAPHVPPALAAIVARTLAKDPAARFANAEELRHQLAPFVRRDHPSARSLPPTAAAPVPTIPPPLVPAVGPHTSSGDRGNSVGIAVFLGALAIVLVVGGGAAIYALSRANIGSTVVTDAGSLADAGAIAASVPPSPAPDAAATASTATSARGAKAAVPANASKTKPRCACIDPRGLVLCPAPTGPRCSCQGQFSICPVPVDKNGSCPARDNNGTHEGAGLRNGDSCSGFRDDNGKSVAATGKLTSCNFCFGKPKQAAVPDTPCQGVFQGSNSPDSIGKNGLWVCD